MKALITFLFIFLLANSVHAKKFTIDFLPKLSDKSSKSQVEQMLNIDSIQYEWKNIDGGGKYLLLTNPKYTFLGRKISEIRFGFTKNKCSAIAILLDNPPDSKILIDELDKISNCRLIKEDESGYFFNFDNLFISMPFDLSNSILINLTKSKCL